MVAAAAAAIFQPGENKTLYIDELEPLKACRCEGNTAIARGNTAVHTSNVTVLVPKSSIMLLLMMADNKSRV